MNTHTIFDVRVGKVHDLRRLIDDCANAGEPIPADLTRLDVLTPYGIVGRYEDVPVENPFSRRELRDLVRRLRQWSESKLG